jgi:uncharacterized membrane protein
MGPLSDLARAKVIGRMRYVFMVIFSPVLFLQVSYSLEENIKPRTIFIEFIWIKTFLNVG